MKRTARSIVLGLIAVLASATVASADMCLTLGAGIFNAVFVAQNFTRPAVGTCKPFLGSSLTFPFAGVACATSDGTTLRVGFTWYGHNATEHYDIDFAVPSLTASSYTQTVLSSLGVGFATESLPATLGMCNPRNQPVE